MRLCFCICKSLFSHDVIQYYIPCEVGSHFMSLGPRIHARGLGYRIKIQYMLKCGISGLKVSRSSYLDNHLSESIHARTKGTLLGWLSFHNIGPRGPCPGCARGQKLVNLQNMVFLRQSPYLDGHLSECIQTWTIGTL